MSLDTQLHLTRSLSWAAAATLFGGLTFIGALWPPGASVARTRQVLGVAWASGLLALAANFIAGAEQFDGTGVSAALSGSRLRQFTDSAVGSGGLARLLLWLLALVVVVPLFQRGEAAVRSAGWRFGALVLGLAFVRSIGLGDDHDGWLTVSADFLHVIGVLVWLGGLVFLCTVVLPRHKAHELATVLPAWARTARISVGLVVAGGVVLAYEHLGGIRPLFTTSYGHTLIVKLVLVAALLAAAYLSKTWVEHRLRLAVVLDGDRQTVQPLVLSVALEVALAIPVLVVAAVLVAGHPPA